MRTFVSSYSVHCPPASLLIERLRREGWHVERSPQNPHTGYDDPLWDDWYQSGLPAAVSRAQLAILVPDYTWDCSTWMAMEADMAAAAAERQGTLKLFYWNPTGFEVRAAGMVPY